MATLATVTDYVAAARVLLQDQVVVFRYPDADLLLALNIAILDARRLRPDLFRTQTTLQSFTAVDSTAVNIDEQYRMAFVYFMVGWAQLRDEEDTQDQRAAALLNKFTATLTGVA